jgi:GNAT superfamily N-acetyltransferase
VVTISPFSDAGDTVTEWHRVYYTGYAAEAGPSDGAVEIEAVPPAPGTLRWAASVGGAVVGAASATPNPGAMFVRIFVQDRDRRHGVGRALFDVVRGTFPTATLRSVVVVGHAGEPFAAALGASVVARLVVMELRLRTAPNPVPMPPGYDWTSWTGSAPAPLLDSYATVKCSIADAPHAAVQVVARWTPARVRAWERPGRFVGAALRAGRVVAFSEIDTEPGSTAASQEDTVVAPEHRGRGLGVAVKSALAAQLHEARPDIVAVTSTISASNAPMLATCRAAGWTEVRRRLLVELPPR